MQKLLRASIWGKLPFSQHVLWLLCFPFLLTQCKINQRVTNKTPPPNSLGESVFEVHLGVLLRFAGGETQQEGVNWDPISRPNSTAATCVGYIPNAPLGARLRARGAAHLHIKNK